MYGELFDQGALDHLKERIYNETMDFLNSLQLVKYQFLSVVLHDNFVKQGGWNMCDINERFTCYPKHPPASFLLFRSQCLFMCESSRVILNHAPIGKFRKPPLPLRLLERELTFSTIAIAFHISHMVIRNFVSFLSLVVPERFLVFMHLDQLRVSGFRLRFSLVYSL